MKVNIAEMLAKGEIKFKTSQNEFLEVIDFGVTVLDCVHTNPVEGSNLDNYSFEGSTKVELKVKNNVGDFSGYNYKYTGTLKEKDGQIVITNPIILNLK
ncbi:MAG: hypothetical protein JZU53_13240 [Paludibacter sp.]|nr:hypothetical protein [Paludibacter sp.]